MSRVTRSTLRAAAACALAASAFGLSACGDDGKQSADASTTPAVVQSTPEQTTPAKPTPKPKAAVIPKVIATKINVTGEGQNKIDSASEKTLTQDQVMAKVKVLMAALDKKGFDTKASKGNGAGPIVIQGGKATTVMVYPSEKMGARQAAGFTIVLKNSKTDARIARKGNILVAVSAPKGLTPALLKEFNTARKVAGV